MIPLLIALFTFAWGVKVFFRLYRPPAGAIEYQVTGKQWMWKIQHPTGQREINELHLPVGQPVALTMTSEDVIHSFFVPAFRAKADVFPGRYTTIWFTPTKPGRYHLFCAEYCGTEHSRHDRLGDRADARGVPDLARLGAGAGDAAQAGQRALLPARLHRLPRGSGTRTSRAQPGGGARASTAFGKESRSRRAGACGPTRPFCASRSSIPRATSPPAGSR